MDEQYNKKLTIWVIANILLVFVGSYLYSNMQITQLKYTMFFIPFMILNILIGAIFYFYGDRKNKSLYIFIIFAVIFGIISTIFAFNKEVALYGFKDRNEGLIAILYYLSLLYVSSFIDEKNKIKVIRVILFTGAIQTIYSILQIYEMPFVKTIYNYRYITENNTITRIKDIWASGFVLNPNSYGAYVLMCLCYSIGLYFETKDKNKYLYLILTILFIFGLLISNCRCCFVGFIVLMLYMLIYSIRNKKYLKLGVVILVFLITTFITVKLDKTTLIDKMLVTQNEAKEIIKGNIKDSFGTKRIYIWRKTLEIVPQNLMHGVGIDNFYYAFNGKPLISPNRANYYDKAHNEYLQILITEGVFALLTYLAIYFKVLYNGFKNKNIVYILPVIGYLVQAFFNISIIGVAPIFYIALGLCINRGTE